jgi:hypothetical protein
MAANMQHMAGAGQMMPQQVRKPSNNQIHQLVYQSMVQSQPPPNTMGWQASISINDRMSKTLNLLVIGQPTTFHSALTSSSSISNASLALGNVDYLKAAEFGCNFERDLFQKAPTRVHTTPSSIISLPLGVGMH